MLLPGTALAAPAAADKPARKGGGSRQPVQTSLRCEVPAHPFDLILGRPTATSVTVSVLCYADAEGCIDYGTQTGKLSLKTPARSFKKGEPAEIVLSGLQPDARTFYQLNLGQTKSREFSFHTARQPGATFSFTLTADSHLDDRTTPAIYQKTLADALAATPDFHIDLGSSLFSSITWWAAPMSNAAVARKPRRSTNGAAKMPMAATASSSTAPVGPRRFINCSSKTR